MCRRDALRDSRQGGGRFRSSPRSSAPRTSRSTCLLPMVKPNETECGLAVSGRLGHSRGTGVGLEVGRLQASEAVAFVRTPGRSARTRLGAHEPIAQCSHAPGVARSGRELDAMSHDPERRCRRCWRPRGHCYCALIPRLETRTRVIFLQHPRESRVAIGTARMAHLALPNSELHEGFSFAGLEALVRDPTAAVLFPGPDSPPTPPTRTLIVVDGTWPQARKIIRRNPLLARLRRFTLTPARPGAYRIRREPTPDCLATIEAVVEVLAILEGDRERCAGLLEAFTFMVERQLDYAR